MFQEALDKLEECYRHLQNGEQPHSEVERQAASDLLTLCSLFRHQYTEDDFKEELSAESSERSP